MYIVSCQLPHLIGLLYKAQCTVMNLTAGECNDGSYDGEVSIYHRNEMLKEKRPLLVFAGKSYCCIASHGNCKYCSKEDYKNYVLKRREEKERREMRRRKEEEWRENNENGEERNEEVEEKRGRGEGK